MDENALCHSVTLPFDRSSRDVTSVVVRTKTGMFHYEGRRKDLEFDADDDEFVFEDERWEAYG